MMLQAIYTALLMWLLPAPLQRSLVDAQVDKEILDYLQSTGCYLMLKGATQRAEICIAVPGAPIRPQLARARDMRIGQWIDDVFPELDRAKADGRVQ